MKRRHAVPPDAPSSVADRAMDRREAVHRVAALLGASLSAPAITAVLVKSAAVAVAPGPFVPRVLSPEQLEQVATIAEHIIPTTDTPGARVVGVHLFIDTMFAEYYTSAEREHLLNGLADVDARARRAHGRAFLACSQPHQRAILEQLDREAFAAAPNITLQSSPQFFRVTKELTLLGYYTSQPGATKELRYLQVPGRFDGCVPFGKIGRAWST